MKKTITDICDLVRGLTFSKGDAINHPEKGYLPVFRSNNIQNGSLIFEDLIYVEQSKVKETQVLQKGDVVITASTGSKAVIGKAAQLNRNWEGTFGAFCLALRPRTNLVDPRFFGYYFQTSDYRKAISHMSSGANINNLKKSYFDELEIDVPPTEEQKRIVRELDAADALRQKRKQAITLLDDYLKAVFLDMFGDPVMNPKRWEVKKIGDICDVRDGTHDSPKYHSNGFPLVTSKNIKNGEIDFSDVSLISREDLEAINKRSLVEDGDILMPMIGTIGNPVIVRKDREFAIKNVALIKFKDSPVTNVYIKTLLDSHFLESYIEKNSRGGTQKFLSLGNIRDLEPPVPPMELQHKFDEIVEKTERLKRSMIAQLNELEENFNSLMQSAFNADK